MQGKSKATLIVLVMLFLTAPMIFSGCGTQVSSGYKGIKYLKFGDGTEMGKIYTEGFNWHLPWNTIYTYKVQVQEAKESLRLLTSDGATIGLEISVWYRPMMDKLDSLQITVGPNYLNVVLGPSLRGGARSVVGRYTPEELYSTKRDEISQQILAAVNFEVNPRFILVENVIIRNVGLPKRIEDAINEKLSAQQEAQRMEFVLLKEEQEANRKRIEAKGIADFQKIVSAGINANLLKWKGIETTEKLAQSPNAKIIIIGNAADGLPLILGGQ